MLRFISIATAVFATLFACQAQFQAQRSDKDGAEQSNTDVGSNSEAQVLSDENGVKTAKVSASSTATQTLSGSAGSSVANAGATFPPGSLAVDTDITIQEGGDLSSSIDSSLLENPESAGPAVVLSSSAKVDVSQPFTVSVPLDTSVGLTGQDNLLTVIFRIKKFSDGKYYEGVIPRSKLTVEGLKVIFTALFFGSYQAVYAQEEVMEDREAETEKEIVTKVEEEENPEPTPTDTPTGPTNPSIAVQDNEAGYINSTSVSLVLSAEGATQMKISTEPDCEGGTWEDYSTAKTYTITGGSGTSYFYAIFKDDNGIESDCVADTTIFDNQPPTSPTISINSDDPYTADTNVTLALEADSATEMYLASNMNCTGGSWIPFASSKAWNLAQSNTTAIAYVKYRDAAGNETDCDGDDIIHDGNDPVSPPYIVVENLIHPPTTTSPVFTWLDGDDTGSGIAGYEIKILKAEDDAVVVDWTNVGNVNTYSFSGMTLP